MAIRAIDAKRKTLIYAVRKALEDNVDLIEYWSKITLIVKSACKRCHGRGFEGFDSVHNRNVLCPCLEIEIQWPKEDSDVGSS